MTIDSGMNRTVTSALLNKKQAAQYLNVTLRWMSRNYGIPFIELGGRKYYLISDLDHYIQSHRKVVKQ